MYAIEAKNLSKKFETITAVNSVSLAVKAGEIFGFLGPNGAGKTTTLKIFTTLLSPTSGSAFVGGFNVQKQRQRVREKIGVSFQEPSLDPALTAEENLKFHAWLYNIPPQAVGPKIKELLALVELQDRKNGIVRYFSGGMKRRLEIARAIMHEPAVLFLDEPTLGLDPQSRARIWEHLQTLREKRNLTVFMTTHYLDEAEICDRVAVIDRGKIIALDTPKALMSHYGAETLNDVFLRLTGRDIRDDDETRNSAAGGQKFWMPGKSL